jgi:hypothetical protein
MKFGCHGDLALGICAPLVYGVFKTATFIARLIQFTFPLPISLRYTLILPSRLRAGQIHGWLLSFGFSDLHILCSLILSRVRSVLILFYSAVAFRVTTQCFGKCLDVTTQGVQMSTGLL